jgi:V8-like Glu-specific endopeptidase
MRENAGLRPWWEGTSVMKYMAAVLLLVAAMLAQNAPSTNKGGRLDIPAISREAHGAVVSIVVWYKNGHPVAQGSGFLISKDGQVVTNYHVIKNGSSAVIKFPDGAFFVVDGVLASDKDRDVAIIKAHGNDFRALTLGDSDRLQVGEEVVAIGSPLSLESTVSNGIVSAIRTVEDEGGKFLQITVPISPGSSGGPLFNMSGKVVGITTSHIKGGENLNFAIPINDVKPMLLARSPRARALPDETKPVTADQTTGPSLENFYSAWSGAIVVDHIYAFTKGYKAKVHMARNDHTIYRFEIACLAKFADCTQLAVGGKFQIEKMLKDDPDLYPSMEDDYNLGSVRVTGSEQSAVYFVINQESAAARSDSAEEARNDEAKPSTATPTPAPGSSDPQDSSLELGQTFKMAVASSDDLRDRYLIVFFTPGKPEKTAKASCLKKYSDCHQLTAGEVYDVVFLNDSDTHRYTDAPLSLRVFGAGRVSGRPASAVYGWMK